MKNRVASLSKKFFYDKKGRISVWQKPNLPLVVWFIAWLLTHILPYGELNFAAALIAFGALFTWAWLELFQGASYFRRSLGLVVLIWLILSRI